MCAAERVGRELQRKALLCRVFHTLAGTVVCVGKALDTNMGKAFRVNKIAVILGSNIGTVSADLTDRLITAAVTVGMVRNASAECKCCQLVSQTDCKYGNLTDDLLQLFNAFRIFARIAGAS